MPAIHTAFAADDCLRAVAAATDHEFFTAEHWVELLCGTCAAPCWPEADGRLLVERKPDGSFVLSFHSSTKNYDGEIDKFLTWISPYIASATGEVIGEFEGEQDDFPTQLIADIGGIRKALYGS